MTNKNLLFILLIFLKTSTYGQYTEIPDINFEKKLINLGLDDVVDAKVLDSNIEYITNLNVSNSEIVNLTGIKSFSSLTSLDCNNNELTNLNIGNNSSIKSLLCNDNQLTSLDISNNTALQYISINNNLLVSLNLIKNSNLKGLSVTNNNLTSLDTSNNIALQNLSVTNNLLESLDISKNNFIKILLCNNNLLTILNLKNDNNAILNNFNAENNADLNCIKVDNVDNSTANIYWSKDNTAFYSTYCATASINKDNIFNGITLLVANKQVEIKTLIEVSFKIFNANGQEVMEGNTGENFKILNLKGFSNGLYFLLLTHKNRQDSKKFLLY